MGYIYKATNIINNKKYIGLTTRTVELRMKEHIKESYYDNKKCSFHNAIKKYGHENFIWETICEVPDCELKFWEQYYVALYKTFPSKLGYGYNDTEGGDNVYIPNEQTRKKMSDAKKGKEIPWLKGRIVSEETRKLQSEQRKGKNLGKDNPNYGHHMCKESRQKISEAQSIKVQRDDDMIFNSFSEAEEYMVGKRTGNIQKAIKQNRKAYGHWWKIYKEE